MIVNICRFVSPLVDEIGVMGLRYAKIIPAALNSVYEVSWVHGPHLSVIPVKKVRVRELPLTRALDYFGSDAATGDGDTEFLGFRMSRKTNLRLLGACCDFCPLGHRRRTTISAVKSAAATSSCSHLSEIRRSGTSRSRNHGLHQTRTVTAIRCTLAQGLVCFEKQTSVKMTDVVLTAASNESGSIVILWLDIVLGVSWKQHAAFALVFLGEIG